ncbi:bifunctional UDP-N-acetylmuramoyl-tripeptide:D-alanyl-D-alanine ligase/alanine racemase [Myroides guanonis]|uniref:Alanine racemase n=1 Tax=Myroides guanonis TaxID=1150112 RepID=A0A1I3MRC0_9FLAO|nr:bifunctional UDP-N-acetylmuramoyl-tripeptide:D-alanyl-D-alanine ligase/alanine racemase [Myroides guanonis]SFI99527.1 UDP-N-acetylmuramoyl-tripeptide--D-alanyl-D-alanine ligase [Myroides guanonis]
MNIVELARLLEAQIVGNIDAVNLETYGVSIDSRSLQHGTKTIFFALTGNNHNGHDFIPMLVEQGVRLFVVHKLPLLKYENVCFLVVSDSLRALQHFASYRRDLFTYPLIGITGSKGKTIVKEWLNFLLGSEYTIIKSPKSYNSQTGVALSLFGIQKQHDLGIFEAGISTVKEMDFLESMLRPTISVLTSIGDDHQEGFSDIEQKIDEKLLLFKNVNVGIVPYDEMILSRLKFVPRLVSWSFQNDSATVQFKYKKDGILEVLCDGIRFDVSVPFNDEASLQNMASCICTMLILNYSAEQIQTRIPNLYGIELRLQVKNGQNNCIVIDDSYNADFQSLKIALDFLEKHHKGGLKTVILSNVFQSGFGEEELYGKVKELLVANQITKFIGIGPAVSKYKEIFKGDTLYPNLDSFLQKFSVSDYHDETILIKGARSFRFDKIVNLLEEKTHETILEVDMDSIRHNLNFYRSKLNTETKVMVMVKAFGYGNGSVEVAKLLSHEKVDYLGVAFADEGIALRKAGIKIPIIVMNPEISAFPAMLAYELEPEIFSFKVLNAFLKLAREHNEHLYPIHLKIDTGMHRLGFFNSELLKVVEILKHTNVLEVKSVFSHLSSSDMPEYRDFTLSQIKIFKEACEVVKQGLNTNPIRHILNTSGIFNYTEHQMDMVRVGIGLYGVGNDEVENNQLLNVGTLKTIILQIRELDEGESVGYGRRFRTVKRTRIATIPIGYADGIHRSWGNGIGEVYINGEFASIVGSICMDMLMVDVTDVVCEEGDLVEIFGKHVSVSAIAAGTGTIPYEIMTSISQRVKRVFFES